MRIFSLAAAMAGMTLTSGCLLVDVEAGKGEGEGGGRPPPDIAARVNDMATEFDDIDSRITAVEGDAVDLPATARVGYTGVATLWAGYGGLTPDNVVVMAGDAQFMADFDAATIEGTMDNFVIVESDQPLFTVAERNAALEDGEIATGSLVLSDGEISGTGFEADFDGTLTTEFHVYDASGELVGTFHGPTGLMLRAGADTMGGPGDVIFTADGVPASMETLRIVAESQP